jgi:hypothetical protein
MLFYCYVKCISITLNKIIPVSIGCSLRATLDVEHKILLGWKRNSEAEKVDLYVVRLKHTESSNCRKINACLMHRNNINIQRLHILEGRGPL